jgi:predicted outer membrane repeat protein
MKKESIPVFLILTITFSLVLLIAGCGGGGGGSTTSSEGVVVYVQPSPTSPSDGKSWASAFSTLQDALFAARSGSEIWVAAGVYTPGSERGSSFVMRKGVAIYGGFNGAETSRGQRDWEHNVTILSGDIGTQGDNSDNCYHVIKGADNAALDGFTITDGNANGTDSDPLEVGDSYYGGGMYNYECNPTIAHCIFSDNSAGHVYSGNKCGQGGGMHNQYSSPIVTDCTFSNNSSVVAGGGINNSGTCTPKIMNCTFTGNTSYYGGGLYDDQSFSTVTGCAFINNSAVIGAGMASHTGSPVITNCAFRGNTATSMGGGMASSKGNYTIINCIFSGNTSNGGGGAIMNYGNTTIINSTLFGNSAEYGGGIYNYSSTITATALIRNSILWGNTAATAGNQIYETPAMDGNGIPGSSSVITCSCVQDGATDNHNITGDPLLNTDLSLPSNSPCIDAGDTSALPAGITTDLMGNPRISGAGVDMGACEHQQ